MTRLMEDLCLTLQPLNQEKTLWKIEKKRLHIMEVQPLLIGNIKNSAL